MRVHISNVANFGARTVSLAQYNTLKISQTMGVSEIGIRSYDSDGDNDRELQIRIDGMLTPVREGDIFILQLPTWNASRFEWQFIEALKLRNIKLIIFLHDVVAEMFEYNRQFYPQYIDLYNTADVIIVPSDEMLLKLREQGLAVKKVVIQKMWDYCMEDMITRHYFARRFFFTGNPDRFEFIKNYHGSTPIELYDEMKYDSNTPSVQYKGYRNQTQLISEMSIGGFGLIWADGHQYDYYKMNVPYKFSTYIAAGIPVISRRGVHINSIIEKEHLGFVVDTLEEADDLVQNFDMDEYWKMLGDIQKIQFLVVNGYYTRELLNEALIMALED